MADILKIANGCIVGSSLKIDGDTWKAVDPERAKEFMAIVKKARAAWSRSFQAPLASARSLIGQSKIGPLLGDQQIKHTRDENRSRT
ncbi:BtpA/SgcQ family protein [Aquamicrobium terrae]|uniref:Aldehyde dehydrogenase family protein n=1 Tax=Aquamicrobium terrae TaxID=1324945 RepID=A0ABV2N282_9HYPH